MLFFPIMTKVEQGHRGQDDDLAAREAWLKNVGTRIEELPKATIASEEVTLPKETQQLSPKEIVLLGVAVVSAVEMYEDEEGKPHIRLGKAIKGRRLPYIKTQLGLFGKVSSSHLAKAYVDFDPSTHPYLLEPGRIINKDFLSDPEKINLLLLGMLAVGGTDGIGRVESRHGKILSDVARSFSQQHFNFGVIGSGRTPGFQAVTLSYPIRVLGVLRESPAIGSSPLATNMLTNLVNHIQA